MSRSTDAPTEPEGFMVIVGNGDRIHFLDWNTGGQPAPTVASGPGILLVHGLSATAWVWAPVARRLASARRTLAIDLPGHGLSDAPTSVQSYAPDALAEAVVAAAEGALMVAFETATAGTGWSGDGRAVVVGHGFGAAVAAWAAVRLEVRCAGLVLVDGGWESLPEVTGMEPGEFLRTTEEPPEVMRSLSAYLDDRRDFDPATWDADQERAARAAVVELPVGRVVPSVRPHALEATVRTAFAYDPHAVLPEVAAPIVVLAAADDEDGTHTRALERTQAALTADGRPPIRVIRFPSDGHNLMRYRPAEVAAAILAVGRD